MDLKPKELKPGISILASYIDAKVDGWTLEIEHLVSGRTIAMTRTSEVSNKLVGLSWYDAIVEQMPLCTRICGEVYVPGSPASEVARCLAHDPRRLRYSAFAMLSHNGVDTRNWHRLDVDACLKAMNAPTTPWIPNIGEVTVDDAPALYYKLLQEMGDGDAGGVSQHDVEGIVLKEAHYHGWWKWKMCRTVDVVVTGLTPGKGKYLGQVGSLVGSVWAPVTVCECGVEVQRTFEQGTTCPVCRSILREELVVVANVSGMDDAERRAITDSKIEDVMGRVFEVEYQYVGAGGKLRHPRFKRWRDDKPMKECYLNVLSE